MNVPIAIIAFVWALAYNAHFGNNWISRSDAETICDGIFAILMALSYVGK